MKPKPENEKKTIMQKLTDQQENQLIDALQNCTIFDIVVIGGGVAGLSAGIYAARDGYNTLILEGTIESSVDAPGGALLLTNEVENYPGFEGGAGGELIAKMRDQAEKFGSIIKEERAATINFNSTPGQKHEIFTTDGNIYCARAIIIATGAIAKQLHIPGEKELYGQGVSSCATCDGFFYKEKEVIVVGGGDTAVEDALLLTKYAKQVTLLVRGNQLRSTGPEAREIIDHPNVKIYYNTNLVEIIPNPENKGIDKVILSNSEILYPDGIFVAIGSNPATAFLKESLVIMDEEGYILTEPNSTKIQGGVPGVYAAGDVADKIYRQASTSAGTAVQAALEARHYLQKNHN